MASETSFTQERRVDMTPSWLSNKFNSLFICMYAYLHEIFFAEGELHFLVGFVLSVLLICLLNQNFNDQNWVVQRQVLKRVDKRGQIIETWFFWSRRDTICKTKKNGYLRAQWVDVLDCLHRRHLSSGLARGWAQ